MDWFLYDNGLRRERVKNTQNDSSLLVLLDHQSLKNKRTLTIDKITLQKFILSLYHYIIQG